MATCAPTARARALTFLNLEQSSAAHTAKVRTLPTTGGAGATSARWAAAAGADRIAVAAANDRVCPRTRSMPSNRIAVARGDAGSTRRCASGVAVACRVAVRRLNGAVWPNVPAADCATSRYSAESTDVLAGNTTHPALEAGSIDAYAPIARVTCNASAELHVAAPGPVARSLLHAAVAKSAHVTIRSAVRYVISTSALASRDDPSGSDVHPQLHAAWPTERRTAEERALQQVLFVEHVFHVDLGPKDRSAHRERVPGARVQNDVRRHLDRLVEV